MGCRMQVSAARHVRDELTHFTAVRRSWLVETFEYQTAQLVLNSLYDWKPVQLVMNNVINVIIFTSSWYDTSGGIQHELKMVQVFLHAWDWRRCCSSPCDWKWMHESLFWMRQRLVNFSPIWAGLIGRNIYLQASWCASWRQFLGQRQLLGLWRQLTG